RRAVLRLLPRSVSQLAARDECPAAARGQPRGGAVIVSGAGDLRHQVQGVADPHVDGARAESNDLVGMIAPEAVFAQAGKPPHLRQPHDAVQLERRESQEAPARWFFRMLSPCGGSWFYPLAPVFDLVRWCFSFGAPLQMAALVGVHAARARPVRLGGAVFLPRFVRDVLPVAILMQERSDAGRGDG